MISNQVWHNVVEICQVNQKQWIIENQEAIDDYMRKLKDGVFLVTGYENSERIDGSLLVVFRHPR
jgi:hypothetical protein